MFWSLSKGSSKWDPRSSPVGVGVAAAVVLTSIYVVKQTHGWYVLREKRKHKQISRKLALEGLERHLNEADLSAEKQLQICSLTLSELQKKLQNSELKAVDVMHAYQKQAVESNKQINAISEIVYEAEVEAVKCDMVKEKSERLLHGIPISIKECLPMQGYDCVLGFSELIDKPFEEDCVIVKVLKHQGAIPFMRTNVPQTMICYDTCNPVFGQTLNPHDTKRGPGGSSGGEAALLASNSSIAGIGGDIGGSIRIPAAFCGIYGFKPMAERFSKKHTHPIYRGQNIIPSAYGPMARDVDGLVLLMKALLCPLHFELDKKVPPIPFRDEIYMEKKKPRIGFYLEDDFMMSTPHMQRAVLEAVDALRLSGYEVVDWNFPNLGWRGSSLWSRAIFCDGGAEILEYLKYDVTDHSFGLLATLLRVSRFKLIHWLLYKLIKNIYPKVAVSLENMHGLGSIVDWEKYVRDVSAFRTEVEEDLMKKKIDVIIAPAFTMPASPVGKHVFASGAASYTAVFNVLNFPAGTMPVTIATAEDSAKMADYPTPDPWHKAIKSMCVRAEGLPLNVQVVAPPWQEERCLRVMKDLETALKH